MIRVSLVREDLERLALLGPSDATAIRAALPEALLERVEHGPKAAFFPLELDVLIVDAVGDVVGFDPSGVAIELVS